MSVEHEQYRRPQEEDTANGQHEVSSDTASEEEQQLVERTARTHERIALPDDETSPTRTERVSSTTELEERLTIGSKGLGATALNFFRTPMRRLVGGAATVLALAGVVTIGVKASNNNGSVELQPGQTSSAGANPAETTPETPTQEIAPELRAPSVETATPNNFVAYFTGKDDEPIVGLEAAKKSVDIPVSEFPTPEAAAAQDAAYVLPAIVNINTSPESTGVYGMGQVALIDQKFKDTAGTGVVDELLESVTAPGTLSNGNKGLKAWAKRTWDNNLSASQYTGRHIVSEIAVGKVTEHGGVTAKQVNVRVTIQKRNLVDGSTFGAAEPFTVTSAWVQGKNSEGELVWQKTFGDVAAN